MRATALEVTETTALVELRPCWPARLFGARTVVVTLDREQPRGWRTRFSDELLSHVRNGALVRRALDFRPLGQLPPATARTA